MGIASIVMRDAEDGNVNMEVVFGGGFDHSSPAHAGIRRALEILDSMGMEVQEPEEGLGSETGFIMPAEMQ